MHATTHAGAWRRWLTVALLAALLLVLLGMLSACGTAPSPTASAAEPLGVYPLVTADGKAVPTDVFHDGVAMRIVSGSMTFQNGNRCVSRMRFVPPDGTATDTENTATYTRTGNTLTLQWEGAGVTTGVLAGDTFTMDNVGLILVYRRGG